RARNRSTSRCRTRSASAAPTARWCSSGPDEGVSFPRAWGKVPKADGGDMICTRTLPARLDLLDLHRSAPARYPLLLDSAAAGPAQGRWDLLLSTNGESIRARDGEGFLDALDREWRAQRIPREEPRWPFRGGWALYLGYELAGEIEPVLSLPPAPAALPVA